MPRSADYGILCRSRAGGNDPWRAIVFRYLRRIVARQPNGRDVLDPEPAIHAQDATTDRTVRRYVVRPRRSNNHLVESGRRAAGAPWKDHITPVALHRVTVFLNQSEVYAHPGDGYEPLSGYVKAIDFEVDAISAAAACEVAYGVTNSYPWELHCESKYLEVVRTYREVGHFRSITVGDMIVVDEEPFVCSHFGFAKSPWMKGTV
jgi:hypothetical protein